MAAKYGIHPMEQRYLDWAERRGLAQMHGGWIRPRMAVPDVGDRVLCISSCDDHLVLDYAGAGCFVDPEEPDQEIAVNWWQPLTWPTDADDGPVKP